MIGKTISHYKILEKLGEGGMGEVYLAEDTQLDRKVALKFLPPQYTSDAELNKRFRREAKAAAALNHPNIITVYEIGEHKGRAYIAMEYVEGESLRVSVSSGQFSVDSAIEIAAQICDGLSAAHQAGIIHRDIKPENIIVDKSGRVRILDFGLAQMPNVTKLTKESTTLGTISYMSPEQFQGASVDHRADIWAVGVVLYEMLTSELPFQGEYEQAVMYSVCNEEPEPVCELRPDVPAHVETVIYKALEKDQTKRYQNVQELIEALQASTVSQAAEPEQEKSIVVLPFENMSPDPDQKYFSNGLTEEIITDLSQIRDLLVISRSSAMTFKGTKKKIREIARDVNVRYVLEGSVRKAGNNLRITAQLIDAASDAHLWAEKYKGTLDDVFDIQEKVSRSIVDALKVKLTPEENRRIAERPIDNVQAYECYLKSREEFWKWSEEGLERALKIIQNGLKILGENELFYVALGTVYTQYIHFGIKKDESYLRKAEECVEKIFDFNPDSSHGYYLKGFTQWWRGKAKEAVKELKKALTIDHNNSDALTWLAWIYAISGKGFAAHPLFRKALEVDPLNPIIYGHFSASELLEGKFDTALETWSTGYQMDPENSWFRIWYAFLFAYDNRVDEANKYIDLLMADTPQSIWAQLGTFLKYALQQNKTKALESVSEELRISMQWNEVYPILMADCYSMINEKEEAINWLEEGIKWGGINYPFLSEYDPFLENIRGEERFKYLMERVKHEWENFEA